ncbi:MAG TPA: SDR family NAD(P)-dependent oxidoreductase [Stellaceae bacterium]|nr:SDR family NAD(P)-dependent oxidoreductase [Stellaceae bacterium]
MKDLAGKFAFVTGAANGIGLGIARALAREGVHVALADIEREGIERAAQDVASLGVRTMALRLDVSDRAAVESAARDVGAEFGRLHICVNNAGVSLQRGPAYEIAPAQWDWLLGVNVFGAVNGVHAFLPLIKRHGEDGHIVNTASIAGLQVHPVLRNGSYSMTKYAVVAFSEALEAELQGSRIGVSVLCPALVTTTINASSRRRPERFGGPFAENRVDVAALVSDQVAWTPDEVGHRVVHAIRNSEFFIFTHGVMRAGIERRHDRILAAFDDLARYEAERNGRVP